jgi:ubiquinone/menaquinone biosynthesis C-methylase UbiE
MKKHAIKTYRSPASGDELSLEAEQAADGAVLSGVLVSQKGEQYQVADGIPNFIYPRELDGNDAEFQQKYDQAAEQYDAGLDWLFKSFYESEDAVRKNFVELLQVQPGQKILEVGCGTGKDSVLIAKALNGTGELFLHELSSGMLKLCRKRLDAEGLSAEYLLGNASYLPFPDGYFDAVFHFGGINTFNEKQRALDELTRVTRVGGAVVVGDESVPPWLREKQFGQVLMKANPLYKYEPPLSLLPACARNVSVRWMLGNAFYIIRYEVGKGEPPLDLDLPIPGKGDSLRLRYFGAPSTVV